MLLNSQDVENLFLECLYTKEECTKGYKPIEGMSFICAFHPTRLEKNKELIRKLWNEIDLTEPKDFSELCYDKHGNLWTGEHRKMELLMLLGLAAKEIDYLVPRELWLSERLPLIVKVVNKDD